MVKMATAQVSHLIALLVFTIIPTYGGDDYKTVALVIEMNGTTLEVSNIATGYTFTINGTPVSNNSVYPA